MHPILLFFFRLLIFYTGLTSALFSLSNFGFAPSSFYARCLTSYAALLLASSYGVLVSVLLRLGGYHRLAQYLVARCFKYAMWIATGVRFEIVEGKQYLSTKPCVIISNHQSELDVLLLGTVFPPYCSVTAKSSLRKVPFLGWFMALSGTVFIDRADKAGAIKAFEGAAEEMNRNKQSVFIFPEGTRSYARGPELGVFKKGAFHLAVRAGVDIVPVVCGNYSGILDIEHRRFRSGRIPVKSAYPHFFYLGEPASRFKTSVFYDCYTTKLTTPPKISPPFHPH